VIPLIISSDKTQLTLFREKTAYPVYLTIGNIPKKIRRTLSRNAQMLIGYLPSTRLEHIQGKTARRRAMGNLFHGCIRRILAPIEPYGETGISMATGNGSWFCCHPILAAFIGDYPEQALVACTFYGRCPKCLVPPNQLGSFVRYPDRDHSNAYDVFSLADGDPKLFHTSCQMAGFRPIYQPFWLNLPYANIFISITPDILHQLHQGVIKHMVKWITDRKAFGPVEINARCRCLPPNHNLRVFSKGLTLLSRISGQEHKDMCRILLGLIVDLPLPENRSPRRLIHAVRAMLDFLYIAQYPSQTTATLQRLDEALRCFHDNKDIFVELGIRSNFNFPKIHSLLHYSSSIMLFGTTDNYNTEQSERLHIDFTKDAYRATNKKQEFKQMTKWVERQEKIHFHDAYIQRQTQAIHPLAPAPGLTQFPSVTQVELAQHPSVRSVRLYDIADKYGAVDFQDALADFVVHHNSPGLSAISARNLANNTLIPFTRVSVFHKIRFVGQMKDSEQTIDAAFAKPEQRDKDGNVVPGRFDTVLVSSGSGGVFLFIFAIPSMCLTVVGLVAGQRVAQVRVVFQIPTRAASDLFTQPDPPTHLAYIEWFSPFPSEPDHRHSMHRITRTYKENRRVAQVVPVGAITRSVHLFPQFGPVVPRDWNASNVLDKCHTFYVNPFVNRDTHVILNSLN
jgi:Plavaka transposase